jgi:hypothetical protein
VLPTGQVVGVIDKLPSVAELIEQIVHEADAALARLNGTDALDTRMSKEVAHERRVGFV